MIPSIELHIEKENLEAVHSKFQALFELAHQTWQISLTCFSEKEIFGVGKQPYFNWSMTAVFTKQMRLFYTSYKLCGMGLGSEGQLACRAMFETFINLKALTQEKDPEEYARLWMLWDFANDEKTGRYIVSRHPEAKAKLGELQGRLADDKKTMGTEKWKNFVKRGPSLLSVKELCDKINLPDAYSLLYPISSGVAHSYDLVSYARPLRSGQIETDLTPSFDFIDTCLATSIALLRDTLAHLDNQLQLKKDKEIHALTEIVHKVNNLSGVNSSAN
ncbi:MAG: hypothetical protein KCHDKBKB_02906 [Elusimicrobia bacterium]|nr:hypothetical protein [Elusimicrobiota bacterium]